MPEKKQQPTTIYEISVTLNGSKPAIWRRIQVSADVTLFKLHRIIQEAKGWTDSHLDQFVVGTDTYKMLDPHADFDLNDSSKNGATYPRCLAGARACPPEDVEGIDGYGEFLKRSETRHPAHAELSEWIGREFDAEKFD